MRIRSSAACPTDVHARTCHPVLRHRGLLMLLALILACALPAAATAQCVMTPGPYANLRVTPESLLVGNVAVARLAASACAHESQRQVSVQGNVVTLYHVAWQDCPGAAPGDVDFPLVALPAGDYVLRYTPEAPVSLACYPWETTTFTVRQAVAVPVPGTTPIGLLLLAGAMLLALLKFRRSGCADTRM